MDPLTLVAGAALAGGALAWEMLVRAPEHVEVTRYRLAVPGLPGELRGRRIVFLSDLHHRRRPGFRELWVRGVVARLEPDMIFLGGDLCECLEAPAHVLAMLEGWAPPLGTYAVFGNNEHKHQDVRAFRGQLQARGVRVLQNSHLVLDLGEERFVVAGADDPTEGYDDLDATLRGRPPGLVTFLLCHSPELFPEAAAAGCTLVFSGHTHGGQVRLPGVGALWTDTPRTGLRYQHGLYLEGASGLVLSKGVGTSKLPIRWLARPEVVVVDLEGASANELLRAD
ncbi:MAG: metallophosphoesterase [Myxococcales bacterium]|nr:metallophosphoesterase [Myxococcales bacterium]